MGDFNNFDANSHKLVKDEESSSDWYKIEINTIVNHLDDGGKLMLRVIDCQGNEFQMIPPSCTFTDGKTGIFKSSQAILGNTNKKR
jgi:hypothetical protein